METFGTSLPDLPIWLPAICLTVGLRSACSTLSGTMVVEVSRGNAQLPNSGCQTERNATLDKTLCEVWDPITYFDPLTAVAFLCRTGQKNTPQNIVFMSRKLFSELVTVMWLPEKRIKILQSVILAMLCTLNTEVIHHIIRQSDPVDFLLYIWCISPSMNTALICKGKCV